MEISLFLRQDEAENQRAASARSKKCSVGQPLPPPGPPTPGDSVPGEPVPGEDNGAVKGPEDEMEQGLEGDKGEMLSMMWLVRGWMLDCGAHGVGKIVTNTNYKRRGFWVVAVMCSACMLLNQLGTMLADIQTYPVTVNLQVVAQPSLLFPVVTVCNSNKLKRSALQALPNDHQLHKGITFEEFSRVGLRDVRDSLSERSRSFDNFTLDATTAAATATPVNATAFCYQDRDYLGEMYQTWQYTGGPCSWGYCPWEYIYDYSPVVSPDNLFECGSGECISQVDVCDSVEHCFDGSDERNEHCSAAGCAANQFPCHDGSCIPAQLRCNSVFDCADGSDEQREHCDLEVIDPDRFTCCNSEVTVPREFLCDGVDDCLGDKSDTYLLGCLGQPNMTDRLPCPKLGTEYRDGYMSFIRPDQIGDGVVDCLFEMDEMCAWQLRLDNWTSPTESDEFAEYQQFLAYVQTQPAKTRWYGMADGDTINRLGHQLPDLVMQCVYDNKACDHQMLDPIESVHQDYGKCYSYAAKRPMTSPGIKYGFSVVFNLEAYDTIGFFAPSSSLKMFLTHPASFWSAAAGEEPYVDTGSVISLSPGQEHAIQIHPVRQAKLPAPYSVCEKYGEGRLQHFRTKDQCESHCRSRRNQEVCGCVDDVNFGPAGSLCEVWNTQARLCVDKMDTGFDPAEHCDCPTSCNSLGYQRTVTSALYPISIPNFFSSLIASFQSKSTTAFALDVLEKYNKDKLHNSHDGIRLLRDSFGRATVYFNDLTETTIEERPVYDFITIISTCGGLLGLYMGFSLLTVLEVVDFFFDLYEVGMIRGQKKRFDNQQKKAEARLACGDTLDPECRDGNALHQGCALTVKEMPEIPREKKQSLAELEAAVGTEPMAPRSRKTSTFQIPGFAITEF